MCPFSFLQFCTIVQLGEISCERTSIAVEAELQLEYVDASALVVRIFGLKIDSRNFLYIIVITLDVFFCETQEFA